MGFLLKRYIKFWCLPITGGLFIFSGIIKMNDPVGTAIKMEEYFSVFAVDFGSFFYALIPWSKEIAVFLIVLELLLGVALCFHNNIRITLWAMLVLLIFFTFLTFYSAYFNKVTDCGCFGEVIKIEPWQSFYKDVFLLSSVLYLSWYYRIHRPVRYQPSKGRNVLIFSTVLFSIVISLNAINHLPLIDFRPYKIGNNIAEQMIPKEQPIIEYTFEKEGKKVQSKKFLPQEQGYVYVSSKILNQDEITPSIVDFRITDQEGIDRTRLSLVGPKMFIIIEDVNRASEEHMQHINLLIRQTKYIVEHWILTASSAKDIAAIIAKYNFYAPFYHVDATVLKTMIRSNPGMMILQDGQVLRKFHHNDLPTIPQVYDVLLW